jgi:small subunit ribosomal protein S19
MSRSKWKGCFFDIRLKPIKLNKSPLKIWSRNSVIPSFLVGKTVAVHNGNQFRKLMITRDIVGFKFGFFSVTRNAVSAKRSLKKVKKK